MASTFALAAAAALLGKASAQMIGTITPEVHPQLTTYACTTAGGCVARDTSVVIDWNYHWMHTPSYTACNNTAGLDPTCSIEGADYAAVGVSTSGTSLKLNQYVLNNGTYQNQSPRVYLLDTDGKNYDLLKLLGQEISYDVDASTLGCGENGALYLSEMQADGGRSSSNPGGAEYGSGYCDAQCPVGSWYNGAVNTAGVGSCCNEMDLWEANANATALTPHPCSVDSIGSCTGDACGSTGYCDKNGCGFNPYALGQKSYYGPGGTVDTLQPMTVTTQFITNDGTTTGTLTEIRRQYIQNGKLIANAIATSASGFSGQQSITDSYCASTDAFGQTLGGLKTMGEALGRGMTLVMSVWNDASGYMTWLDSGNSGPCSATEGNPALIIQNNPTTHVVFSNIRVGDIGSTFQLPGGPVSSAKPSSSTVVSKTSSSSVVKTSSTSSSVKTTSTSVKTTSTSAVKPSSTMATSTVKTSSTTMKAPPMPTQTHWGQCGGQGWTGPTMCASPWKCTVSNPYYSQCI